MQRFAKARVPLRGCLPLLVCRVNFLGHRRGVIGGILSAVHRQLYDRAVGSGGPGLDVLPASQKNGVNGADLKALGIPSVEETVARYAEKAGVAAPTNLDWLMAYNLFRLAAICQGIGGRVRDGTAASAHAVTMAAQVEPLSAAAWSFAKKAGA